jgi:hypothetical protein
LGPLLANIFMAHVEKSLFDSDLKQEIGFWTRYVDDIFVVFDKLNPKINDILLFLNKIHPNIKFTVENEINHCLHFLDINIEFVNGKYVTSTYKKPTSTNLYTMWNSFSPLSYKLSTVRSLFIRSLKICSNNNILLKEKLHIIQNFHLKLDYPLHVLYEIYRVCVANQITDRLIFYGPHKPRVFVTLPFIGQLSCNKVKRLIKSVIVKNKCIVDLKFVFVNKFAISSLFKFKDSLPLNMKSHVVYGLKCMDCAADYIGVTTRVLPARVQEHRDALRGIRSSAVADHALQTRHNVDWNNVKIFATDSNEINLFYFESLLILKHKPVLNKMHTSVNLNLFT